MNLPSFQAKDEEDLINNAIQEQYLNLSPNTLLTLKDEEILFHLYPTLLHVMGLLLEQNGICFF